MKNSFEKTMMELSSDQVANVAGGMGVQADQICRVTADGFVCEPAPQLPRPFPFPFPGGVVVVN